MRATSLAIVVVGAFVAFAAAARADEAPATSPAPGPADAPVTPPKGEAPTDVLPPPSANMTSGSGAAMLTPPPGPSAAPASPNDWKFSWNGYLRAPLRIGVGSRPACGPGQMPTAATV